MGDSVYLQPHHPSFALSSFRVSIQPQPAEQWLDKQAVNSQAEGTAHHSCHIEQGHVPSLSSDLSTLRDQRMEIANCSLP